MPIHFAEPDELASWNQRLLDNPNHGDILQSREFADLKAGTGWTPRYLVSDKLVTLVLEKKVPLLGTYWYAPKGPGVTSPDQLGVFLDELVPFAKQQNVFTVTIEPELTDTDVVSRYSLLPIRQIQPNISTVIIDLNPSEDDVLASFGQTARRMIRKAEKEPCVRIEAVEASDENCKTMYALYQETADGQFSTHGYEYYQQYWQSYSADGLGQLLFAYHEDTVVAAVFIAFFGTKALYKDGASVRAKTVQGISHLLQWEVMKWLKAQGKTSYDLHGTPRSDKLEDTTQSFYGIGRFKTSFSKDVIDYVGTLDVLIDPSRTKLWHKLIKKIVLKLYYRKHGYSWY